MAAKKTRGAVGFAELGLSDWLCQHISCIGFVAPTEVQRCCIPPILAGQDCVGCSKTGSGKTAAFALPIVQRLAEDPHGVFAVVVTPTRELAYLLSEQFDAFGSVIGIKTAVFVGKMDLTKQKTTFLRSPHVVIATPGRLADLVINTECAFLRNVKFLVLDEADFLLRPSFSAELEIILQNLPTSRQTLLFGATLSKTMTKILDSDDKTVFTWRDPSVMPMDSLDQRYILIPANVKEAYLIKAVESFVKSGAERLIIFTHTCRSCQVISLLLKRHDIPCIALHSLLNQRQRFSSVLKFKSGEVNLLVATDVAGRGLDIPQVSHVINLNVPASAVDYVHRVGRAARGGRPGTSLTLVTQYDILRLQNIEQYIGCRLKELDIDEKETLEALGKVRQYEREINLRLPEKGDQKRKR